MHFIALQIWSVDSPITGESPVHPFPICFGYFFVAFLVTVPNPDMVSGYRMPSVNQTVPGMAQKVS